MTLVSFQSAASQSELAQVGILRAHGYGVLVMPFRRGRAPMTDFVAVLRFGHDAWAGEGIGHATVCLTLVGRDDKPSKAMTRWSIKKTFASSYRQDRLTIVLEADLVVPGAAAAAVRRFGIAGYRMMRRLLADARRSLVELPAAHGEHVCAAAGPVVHAELTMFGDLVAGRSGLAADQPHGTATDRRLRVAICDQLTQHVLPDLARVCRAATAVTDAPVAPSPQPRTEPAIARRRSGAVAPAGAAIAP